MSHVPGCGLYGKPGARWYGPGEIHGCTCLSVIADTATHDGERRQCPAHGPLDESGGCAGCVADDRATDAWEGN